MGPVLSALVISADSAIGGAICDKIGAVGTTRRKPTLGRIPFDLKDPINLPLADVSYFCSGINGFKACEADPEMARKVNLEGTVATAQDIVSRGGRVVLLSSCAVETHPETVYGALKRETENGFMQFGDRASIFRFGPVMFPGRVTYPNQHYSPIGVDRLVDLVTNDFSPGLHRIFA